MEKEIWDQNIKSSADILRQEAAKLQPENTTRELLDEILYNIEGGSILLMNEAASQKILDKLVDYTYDEKIGTLRSIVDNLWQGYNDISKNNESTPEEVEAANSMKGQLEEFNKTY